MVSNKLKKEMRIIAKDMKKLRKLSKKDYKKSIDVSDGLIIRIDNLIKGKEVPSGSKEHLNLKKIKDSLLMYNSVFAKVEGFNEKWKK